MALTRDEILSVDDLPVVSLEMPEWGGSVQVRSLSAEQREDVEIRASRANSGGDVLSLKGLKALIATYVLVGADGKPLFTPADAPKLAKKSAAALDRLFEFVLKTNAMSSSDADSLVRS